MELAEKIFTIITENTENDSEVNLNSDLVDDLSIGSFERLMIVNSIEDEFSIQVDDADLNKLKTVGDIISLLDEKYLI